MDHPRNVLGKRARRSTRSDRAPMDEEPKRSRTTRRSDRDVEPRNGLLTPEASALTDLEAQIPLPLPIPVPTSQPVEASEVRRAYDPTTTFPFMLLPAELRLHIYHMALVRTAPLTLHAIRAPDTNGTIAPNPADQPFPRTASTIAPVCPADPVVPVILRLNRQIHKEARQLLYAENVFTLTLASGIYTLSTLHQRSRSLIKHVVLTIPSHHDILDGFADLVRLGLRYCWGLKTFRIILHASLPDDGRVSGATSVYANAFHILRWLPRGCSVALEGCVSETVMRVVSEEGRLMNVLDERSYLKRQHQMPERH